MRVNTKIVINMITEEVVERESYEYAGPVAEAAGWTYATTDTLTRKVWAKEMFSQFMQETWFMRCASREDSACVYLLDNLSKNSGDSITYGVSQLLSGPGVTDLNTLTGNEEAPTTFGDSLVVHELCHAVLLVGPISIQRVLFDMRKTGRNRLADWYAARADHSVANQLAGQVQITDTRYTGLQAPTAPAGPVALSRQVIAPYGGTNTDAASITNAQLMDIRLTDTALSWAKSLTAGIRPMQIAGRKLYLEVMHPSQVKDLRTSTSTGQWFDIEKAAMTGGDIGDNPIFWESLGMYHGVLLHENARVPNAVSNAGAVVANTKRAPFLGAQAATIAFGRYPGENSRFRWLEELRDFGRQMGIGVSSVWGCKKVVFNSNDFGSLVIDTYAIDVDVPGSGTTISQ
jgi:N4-gp56 family major capsid protein